MLKYKNIIIIAVIALSCFAFLAGCENRSSSSNDSDVEQPHLYWKDIDVTITDIDKRTWFASTRWYEINLSVHSDEYDLDEKFNIKESGFYCPKSWEYETGDTVKAQLYTWKIDSTGEITKRQIHQIY